MWNCSASFNDGMATTNNAVESWNARFNRLVGRAHPRLWRFIEKLKQEQEHTGAEIVRAEHGEPPGRKRRSVTLHQNRLHDIVDNATAAGAYDVPLLRSVVHNFQI